MTEPATEPNAENTTPPWGSDEEFNPEKAWGLIQNLRADKEKLAGREAITDEQKQQLAEYDRLVEASKTELEREKERASSLETRATAMQTRAVRSEVRALARDFADPEDAAAFLSLDSYVTDDGDIDSARIESDLKDLLEQKPHLGRPEEGRRTPRPDPSQGSAGRGSAASPANDFASFLSTQLGR